MQTRLRGLAAVIVALVGLGNTASAQYPMGGPMGGPMGAPGGGFMGPYGEPAPGAYGPYGPPGMAPVAYSPAEGAMQQPPMDYAASAGGAYYDDGCIGWKNHYFAFGEFLYLRPRNAEVAYAVPIDGTVITGPTSEQVQVGGVRLANPDYSPGFRVGFGANLSDCDALAVTYAQLDSTTFSSVSLPGTGAVLRSLVTHPNPLSVGGDGLDAAADLATQFKILDIDYKSLFAYTDAYQLAYVVGARYAHLHQRFGAGFIPSQGSFDEVLAASEFDGGGIKLGLEGTRYGAQNQFFVYGKGYTSFVAGTFRTNYQFNRTIFDPTHVVLPQTLTNTNWEADRIVTILDLEAGIGWHNFTDNLRLSVGYMVSQWFNTVKVNEWINAVQQNNFVDPSDNFKGMIAFDGLTAKIELLW